MAELDGGNTGFHEDQGDFKAGRCPPKGNPFGEHDWTGETWFFREGFAPRPGAERRRLTGKRVPVVERLPVGDGLQHEVPLGADEVTVPMMERTLLEQAQRSCPQLGPYWCALNATARGLEVRAELTQLKKACLNESPWMR